MKPTNPFLSTDFTCLPGAMSPGSSDISGQCFAQQKAPFASADLGYWCGTAPLPRLGLDLAPGARRGLDGDRAGKTKGKYLQRPAAGGLSRVPLPLRACDVPQPQLPGLRWK